MDILNKLQNVSCCVQKQMKLSELDIGIPYPVKSFKPVTTKFGRKIIAQLQNNEFTYLPSRISESFNDEELQELNTKKLALVYKGVTGNTSDISFEEVVSDLADANRDPWELDISKTFEKQRQLKRPVMGEESQAIVKPEFTVRDKKKKNNPTSNSLFIVLD